LRNEEQQVWPDLCQRKAIHEIEQFSQRLKDWAQEGEWPALLAYSQKLEAQAQEFDLDGLPRTLEAFPEIIRALS
jgi:hypothetical protein